jgi:glycosyltransferase involved in cell wall biosynthesis
MTFVFCWSDVSGYMAACWRELAARPGVQMHVFAYGNSNQTAFDPSLMDGVPWTALDENQRNDAAFLGSMVAGKQPEVVVLAGWLNHAYVALTRDSRLARVKFIMGMDTPWRDTVRQRLARFAIRGYLSRLSAVFVPGERAWQFARRLGISADRIHRGMYGVDWEGFASANQRAPAPVPRFMFVGRYETMKGVDVLIDAYRLYRQSTPQPWELHFCGMGPLAYRLQGEPGITDHGFCQPGEVRRLMAAANALVLPSRYDPWPLIVVEGAAAGLPLLVSEACGSAVELVRPMYNGLTVSAAADAKELASAMVTLASRTDLKTWGLRSQALAEPYAATFWSDRWLMVAEKLLNQGSD